MAQRLCRAPTLYITKTQEGEEVWNDFCRGPHLLNTKPIIILDAITLQPGQTVLLSYIHCILGLDVKISLQSLGEI